VLLPVLVTVVAASTEKFPAVPIPTGAGAARAMVGLKTKVVATAAATAATPADTDRASRRGWRFGDMKNLPMTMRLRRHASAAHVSTSSNFRIPQHHISQSRHIRLNGQIRK
jgi:hypothetical protein